jgi:hypothetical protein
MLGNKDPPSAPIFETISVDRLNFSIRLLRIQIRANDRVERSLEVYDLESSPPSIALSYEWGEDSSPRTVHLNNNDVVVRKNLCWALDSLTSEMRGSGVSLIYLYL